MILQDGKFKIELKVLGYQFPDSPSSQNGEFNFDSNWLTIQIAHQNETEYNEYKDSCLLTTELEDIIRGVESILDSTQTEFISDCLEPNFKLSVSKTGDEFVLLLYFSCYSLDGKLQKFTIRETVSKERLTEILEELKEYSARYPQR